ncbi:hypothetical protein [Streptomyces sp. NPDC048202]|uniref:hypothetical protein n=1 Tax=Streptomyces sp. NPDC048202 TaxID=3365514 RepID=UPI003714F4E0
MVTNTARESAHTIVGGGAGQQLDVSGWLEGEQGGLMHSISTLRHWLHERPQLVLRLFRHVDRAHGANVLYYRSGPAAAALRKTNGARLWVSRAPEGLLLNLSRCGMSVSYMWLDELGRGDELADPDLGQLAEVLSLLPEEMAQLLLFEISLDAGFPAHRLTHSHADDLWKATQVGGDPIPNEIWERPSCLMFSEGEPDDIHDPEPGRTPVAGKPEGGEPVTKVAPVDADTLSQQTALLRADAGALADRMEAFTAAMRDGRLRADEALLRAVLSWARERRGLASAFVEAGAGTWNAEQSWTEAEALTGRLREEEEVRHRTEREIADVTLAREEARALLENLSSDLMRASVIEQIADFDARIARLRGDTSARVKVTDVEKAQREPSALGDSPVPDGGGGAPEVDPAGPQEESAPSTPTTSRSSQAALKTTEDGPGRVSGGPEKDTEEQPGDTLASAVRSTASVDTDASVSTRRASDESLPEQPVAESVMPFPAPVPRSVDVWSGDQAPVVDLVIQGRLAEAYWLTRAAGAPDHRALALEFADAAFHVSAASASELQVQTEERLETVRKRRLWDDDHDTQLVLLTAAVRSGISARWASSVLTEHTSVPGLPTPWADVLDGLVQAVRMGVEIEPGSLQAATAETAVDRYERIADQARQLAVDLPQRKIRYQRATVVLQTLAASDGVLGRSLQVIENWAASEGRAGQQELLALSEAYFKRLDAVDRLIDETDRAKRSPKQSKDDIYAGARHQLRTHIKSVQDLLKAAVRMAEAPRASGNREVSRELKAAVKAARTATAAPGVGGALLGLLLRWLDRSYVAEARDTWFPPPTDGLLMVPGLPWRTEDGRDVPDLSRQETFDALSTGLDHVDPAKALVWHREQGDLHLAARVLRQITEGGFADAGLTTSQITEMRQASAESSETWKTRCAREHRRAQLGLARVRAHNLLTRETEREFTGLLLDLEGEDHGGRYRERLYAITAVAERLGAREQERTDDLRQQLDHVQMSEQNKVRIHELLDRGETVAAEELLSFARRGQSLPQSAKPASEVLSRFLEGVAAPDAPQSDQDGGSARWWANHYTDGDPLVPNAEAGLQAWDRLAQGRDERKIGRAVVSVLRLLGLSAAQPNVEEASWGVTKLSVRADITESTPGYVAALGSQARRTYKVVVITDELRGEGPLRHLPASAIGANIILYTQPLGVEGRHRLAMESRGRTQQALVVDPAVVGWVAARAPRSFRAMQRVTLPWTGYTPYTPHVAGLVPPEVFKGRTDEMRAVIDPQGPIFLFGGRQLGKSSLLRQAAEVFQKDDRDNRVAVYVDLMKADIGHAEPPEGIWRMLLAELKRRGVLSETIADRAPAHVIATAVQQWIETTPERRILLLADEADAFLTADAQAVYTGGGQSTFPTVKRLQRLMEDTGRDFKVVFAGLHQVQRFNRLINVVTAHGGRDVPVGPLDPQDAVELVEKPMAAVGLTFETRDLVWHILGLTNYQANLLQIFCDHLVAYMQQRPMPGEGRHVPITWEDVQQVAGMEEVRGLIAERLRYTINLEDRYRVLALLIAVRSREEGHGHGYRPAELLEHARERWSEGFRLVTERQLIIYLDEMVNLGLLIKLDGERVYVMRSPNVVNMLGTKPELENELRDTQFDQPYDYDPKVARRSLGSDRRTRIQRMSPLTDGQLSDILDHTTRTTFVPCTPALGADLVRRGLELHVDGHDLTIVPVGPDGDLTEVITANSRRSVGSRLLFVDLRGQETSKLQRAVERLLVYTDSARSEGPSSAPPRRYAVVLCDPEAAAGVEQAAGMVHPERWNLNSLRAWPESPFTSPDDRRNLIQVTGGWPALVELAMAKVRLGKRQQDVFQELLSEMASPQKAEAHLRLVGLDASDVHQLTAWAQFYEEDDHRDGEAVAGPSDLQAAFVAAGLFDERDAERALEAAEAFLARLDRIGVLDVIEKGSTLDPVTFRALKAIGDSE